MRTIVTIVLLVAGCAPRTIIEHPEMTPRGTWEKPIDLGTAPGAPWSATTIEAAVNGKARDGESVVAVGEIVDLSCYIQLGKHGEKHRACGQGCVKNGQPAALLTRDGEIYVLMPEPHHPRRDGQTGFQDAMSEHMADIVRVRGTSARLGELRAIYLNIAKP